MVTTSNSNMTIHQLLGQYRERISNPRDLGTIFERLSKTYFEIDPIYAARFRKVWLWNDWPQRWGPDCGIDLVAEDFEGNYCAIQCKFYSGDYTIVKEDIDSFFTESGREFKNDTKKTVSFLYRIIVTTTNRWSDNARRSIKNQKVPVTLVGLTNFDESPIEWASFDLDKPKDIVLKDKKKLRPHQNEAIKNVLEGYKTKDRGKLIMACGTGKTFTALKLAEQVTKNDGVVLFLVPSISLLSQTLRDWTAESSEPINAFAVCSDGTVGKNSEDMTSHDLAIPASTDTAALIDGLSKLKKTKRMTVVFSTYQSIDVVSKAQKKGLPEFDIIICDEAHRTTGVTLEDEEESHFVKVHDQKFIKGKKRLYMTATPRIFAEAAKTKADEAGAVLCSMDDESVFGPELHRLGFGKAVGDGLLTDYKVLVLAVDEKVIDGKFQRKFTNEDGEIPLEDIVKIIGCWNGLSKKFVGEEAVVEDNKAMKRAVGFARAIKDSKKIATVFQDVVQEYIKKNPVSDKILNCELEHVDGTFNVFDRNAKLDWLKAETPDNTCRILTNARCLSEGVDVPALDAVIFLNPRNSMVDVVQSVGRIMRRAEGKKYGYVILPIGIPAGVPPEIALKDNTKYKVVWQVLQALRAHDDRFDAEVNKIELNKNRSASIQVIGVGGGGDTEDGKTKGSNEKSQYEFNMPEIEDWKDAIYAKIVLKCGSRPYWENWANDVAKIAEKHTDHIKKLLESKDVKPKQAFEKYLVGIRKNINPSISADDAVEMLSQHLITKPIFDALFEHYKFTEKNPVSQSLQEVLKVLEGETFKEDAAKLKGFYDSVRMRVKGINNPEARQKIIVELYDRFFKIAFPKMSERLGIVYTPVEVVDFIIHSVEAVLKDEFGQSLSDKNVHILDPFTGTGTFIVRLLQSGLIKPEDIKRKFSHELHANEIVLLAYYIAAINIEETYHGITGGEYEPFEGAVLTDTFQLSENEVQGTFESVLPENSTRVELQKKASIQVIMSNPPYASKQKSANDNNPTIDYPKLDERISETYVRASLGKGGKSTTYDGFIRAFRWASDRIGKEGVIGLVTNGSFLDSNSSDGLRLTIAKEFTKIYCFNLRGNARTQGEDRRKEKGNVFGEGTRTPVAITILVKNRKHTGACEIYYRDIGDYLSREEKISILVQAQNIRGLEWTTVEPNTAGDWLRHRDLNFYTFLLLGTKDSGVSGTVFSVYSNGVLSGRDPWVYNFSKKVLIENMSRTTDFYNSEVGRIKKILDTDSNLSVDDLINHDSKSISWGVNLKNGVKKSVERSFQKQKIRRAQRRPFEKSWHYADKHFNHSFYSLNAIFPDAESENIVISVTGIGEGKLFSVLVSDLPPDFKIQYNAVLFPMYRYTVQNDNHDIIEPSKREDAITDDVLTVFKDTYGDSKITKADLFYYIYGVFHSPLFREKYQNSLSKELPRIPLANNFWLFSGCGRQLANIHLHYETVEPFALQEEIASSAPENEKKLYRINEAGMKFSKIKKEDDRTSIIYNSYITLKGIPLEAYDYIVNGKSAIEWVMERYSITTDLNAKNEGSGIKNDPNEWSEDPRYIIDLVKRVVRVSLETNRIVSELPEFELLSDVRK